MPSGFPIMAGGGGGIQREKTMAVNKPIGDNARRGAFMDQKKAPAKKKFKGVRREKRT